jgi:hypothetical protein
MPKIIILEYDLGMEDFSFQYGHPDDDAELSMPTS